MCKSMLWPLPKFVYRIHVLWVNDNYQHYRRCTLRINWKWKKAPYDNTTHCILSGPP